MDHGGNILLKLFSIHSISFLFHPPKPNVNEDDEFQLWKQITRMRIGKINLIIWLQKWKEQYILYKLGNIWSFIGKLSFP